MTSKWFKLKPEAIRLRLAGNSLRDIEKTLQIPKSTLSGWFKEVILTEKQYQTLNQNRLDKLVVARKLAAKWHKNQKEGRLKEAEEYATKFLTSINPEDKFISELAMAILYLGEGFKTKSGLGLGNSDPLILKFFIKALIKNYSFDVHKIKCELHLRVDQDPTKMKRFWSKELNIPLKNFMAVSVDQRTFGSPTYANYNGVCVLRCGNIAIQRKLLFIARKFCERAVSSAGRALT